MALTQAAPPPNKQLQRTVIRRRGRGESASFHCAPAPRWLAQRAAAELRRSAELLSSWPLSDSCDALKGVASRENLLEVLRYANPQAEQNVVLSEAFTLSLQRIARSSAGALRRQRCNDSVKASLSAGFNRVRGFSVVSRARFNGPRRAHGAARGVEGPPNTYEAGGCQ
jgi:hypothetical protein